MQEYLNNFIEYISSEKGLSEHTLEAYKRTISLFIKTIEDNKFSSPTFITFEHIIYYLSQLKNKKYASSTIYHHTIALRVFFRFLYSEKVISINPAKYLDTPKIWHIIPDILSEEEVQALFSLPEIDTEEGSRDRAILEILYGCGLRVSEVCFLKIYDVNDDFLKVTGKGKKERLVPLGHYALEAIDGYLTNFRCAYDSEHMLHLFLTNKGKQIDRFAIWKMVKIYAEKAKITKTIYPHTLRHSYATHLLANGADLRIIQELLGHSSIASTDRYTQINRSHLISAFESFHPRLD